MQNAVSSYRNSNNPETTNINNGAPISMNGHNMPNIRIQQKFYCYVQLRRVTLFTLFNHKTKKENIFTSVTKAI